MGYSTDFLSVTELAGDEVSREQVERICHRYVWAAGYCRGKDVLEAACGTGQGLGLLKKTAATLAAGDYSSAILEITRSHYGDRINITQFDAQSLPFAENSLDVVILFEAIYYLPDAGRFLEECRRVLRPSGLVLIATANKDLFDFNPSPFSHKYYGAEELGLLLSHAGFIPKIFGYMPVSSVALKQKALRPAKMLATKSGLMPKTTQGKKLLKKLVFGKLVTMPEEISAEMIDYQDPVALPAGPDRIHKVLYAAATFDG